MKRPRTYSPAAIEAANLLGAQIRLQRLERRWTAEELAERVGISHVTMSKIEKGDLTVGLGFVLEAAVLVGVPLFHESAERRRLESRDVESRLALVPSHARRPARDVDVDF